MNVHPINRAITFIETVLDREIRLDEVERHSYISRFHLSRVFATATGYPPIQYHRLRRLTEAAKQLGEGDRTILEVALEAGYGSHAAFTRAFIAWFGVSPTTFMKNTTAHMAKYVEPLYWSHDMSMKVAAPRIEFGLDLTLVGLQDSFTYETRHETAALYTQLEPFSPQIPNIKGSELCVHVFNVEEKTNAFNYFMGYPVSELGAIPAELTHKKVTGEKFAVFTYEGDVSEIEAFIMAVLGEWLPESELEVVDGSHVQRFKAVPDADAPGGYRISHSELWIPVH